MKTMQSRVPTRVIVPLVALFAVSYTGAAFADKTEPKYTMTVYSDSRYGMRVLNGDLDKAIESISVSKRNRRGEFESKTNLCVAHTKKGELEAARSVCDAAVSTARQDVSIRKTSRASDFAAARERQLAVALSNRGVLRVVDGDTALAKADFEEAEALYSGFSAPKINLSRLEATR